MSHVKGKNTKPEVIVRKILHSMGYRYRLNHPDLPGKPDIVLTRHKKIVMVHGCFWHGHTNCKRATIPETNSEFWLKKINGNIQRDKDVIENLTESGWEVLIVWACQIKGREALAKKLLKFMRGDN